MPPGDAEALATALGRLLDDPELRGRLGAAGRLRVQERFTWRAAAAGTAEWYRERIAALRGGGPAPEPDNPAGSRAVLTVDFERFPIGRG